MDEASKKRFDRHLLYIILSFILGIIALTYALSDIDCKTLVFSLDKMSTLLGVFISILGLFVTAYFVILAIDAYAHIKDIERTKNDVLQKAELLTQQCQVAQQAKEKIQKDAAAINLQIQKTEETIKMYSEMLYEDLGERIALEGRGTTVIPDKNRMRRRNALKLRQARLCYIFPMLDINIREKLLLLLGDIGEEQDIYPIKQIIENEKEDKYLKEIAKTVVDALEKKLKIKNGFTPINPQTETIDKHIGESNSIATNANQKKKGCMPVFLGIVAIICIFTLIFT